MGLAQVEPLLTCQARGSGAYEVCQCASGTRGSGACKESVNPLGTSGGGSWGRPESVLGLSGDVLRPSSKGHLETFGGRREAVWGRQNLKKLQFSRSSGRLGACRGRPGAVWEPFGGVLKASGRVQRAEVPKLLENDVFGGTGAL